MNTNLEKIRIFKSLLNKTTKTAQLEAEFEKNPFLFSIFAAMHLKDQQTMWLIKLDSKDSYNKFNIKKHTYSIRRDLKTTTVKRAGEKVYNAELQKLGRPATAEEKAAAQKKAEQKMLSLAKRRMRMKWLIGDRMGMNKDVTAEVLATKHAGATGMQVQNIQVFEGTWREQSGTPKLLTISVWEKKFKTFEEYSADKNYNQDADAGKMPPLEFKGGNNLANDYLCYNDGDTKNSKWVSASNKISGLGQNLAIFLRHGDFDAIGKLGQNKGLVYNEKSKKYEMFGIDFGHAFSTANHLKYLSDDFSVGKTTYLLQQVKQKILGTEPQRYEMMYDTPYSEKMAGIHILLKQRGEPPIISEKVKDSFSEIWNNDSIKLGGHNIIFENEIKIYQDKIRDTQDKKSITRYKELIKEIQSTQEIANKTDKQILKVFGKRLNLTSDELDLLSGMEKLVSVSSEKSPNGAVILNEIRVDRKDRIEVQFDLDPTNNNRPIILKGKVTLRITPQGDNPINTQKAIHDVQKYLATININDVDYNKERGTIQIPVSQISKLKSVLSDQNIRVAKGFETHPDQLPADFKHTIPGLNKNKIEIKPNTLPSPTKIGKKIFISKDMQKGMQNIRIGFSGKTKEDIKLGKTARLGKIAVGTGQMMLTNFNILTHLKTVAQKAHALQKDNGGKKNISPTQISSINKGKK
jgi:hypothetical protein